MRIISAVVALLLSTFALAEIHPLPASERNIFFPYIYFDREEVLLDGIDFDATLKIAEAELAKGGADSILTIWTIRDQIISPADAARIGELYLAYIDGTGIQGLGKNFAVWHFAWAIGNIYRLGDEAVKAALQSAYEDALQRPDSLTLPFNSILKEHLTADRIYMGDAHAGGRAYARTHIVIPGNPDYLQSYDDYLD